MVKYDYEKLWIAMKNIVNMNTQYHRNMFDIYSQCNTDKKPPENIASNYYAWAEAAELMNNLEEQNKIEVKDEENQDSIEVVEPTEEDEENVELNEEYE